MFKRILLLELIAFSLVLLCNCTPKSSTTVVKDAMPDAEEVVEMTKPTNPGINLEYMDTSVDPGEDFYRYVNGSWLANNEIPSDRTRWGSFDILGKKSSENVMEVLNEAIASNKYPKGTDQYKAVEFYKSAIDTNAINKQGLSPIQGMLDEIAEIKTLEDAVDYGVRNAPYDAASFMGFAVFADLMNSTMNTAYLTPIGLGLPDRDYYVNDDDKSVEIRQQYVDHITRMLGFLGRDGQDAQQTAQKILDLETQLATHMMTKEERRNPTLMYNPKTMAELNEMTPIIDWNSYFTGLGVGDLESVIVMQPKYIQGLNTILKSTDIETIKDFYTWTDFNNSAGYLSREIELANFDFYGKTLKGQEVQRPRWERALRQASSMIGEPIGKLYVDKYFPPEAKEKAQDMIDNVKVAFENRINSLEWMTQETKVKALDKLNNFTVKIGYPDEWKDYSKLEILSGPDGGSYAGNLLAISKWGYQDMLSKLGEPVDKSEWGMSPQTVNAYYNPLNNEIVFPAAILQPPFYDYTADEAVNYGGIGAVIGHEMSHGFDDQGSRFDAQGNMVNWWTEDDTKAFAERNKKLIDQFDAYEPLPGVFVNGEFTLGENIGDLGGINVAYDALQLFLEKEGRPAEIDGFSPEQRFFMSWSTIWRQLIRDEALINRIKTDPHSPGVYRANGPLTNMQAFYDAFDVTEGDGMYTPEEDRVAIW